jgi:hypothetical protein
LRHHAAKRGIGQTGTIDELLDRSVVLFKESKQDMPCAWTHMFLQSGIPEHTFEHPQIGIVGPADGEADVVQGWLICGGVGWGCGSLGG